MNLEMQSLREGKGLCDGNRWESGESVVFCEKEEKKIKHRMSTSDPHSHQPTSLLYVNYPHLTWNILHRGSSHVGGLWQLISWWAHDE